MNKKELSFVVFILYQLSEVWGMPVLVGDAELLVAVNDTDVTLVQRGMMVTGAFGTYLFSLSAWSQELLEEATETLTGSLTWKQAGR